MKRKLRIYGYCRVSTVRQAMEGYSVDEQERRIRSYVETFFDAGTYELEILREEGKSAKNLDRPQMQKLLSDAKKRKVDILIFFCLNRLTRSLEDTLYLLQIVNNYGIEFVSISEKLDTTSAMGRFFIQQIASLAELEREQISERTKRGILESARQGNYCVPKIPYGYRRSADGHHLEIYEPHAEIVREIFRDIADGAYTPFSKREELRAFNKGEKKWSVNSVYRILNNSIYYGTFQAMGEVFPDHSPAIVSKELYDAAQERIQRGSKGITKHKYLFKNYCFCSACGKALNVTTSQTTAREIRYYKCSCTGKYISEEKLIDLLDKDFSQRHGSHIYKEEMDKLQKELKASNLTLKQYEAATEYYGIPAEDMLRSLVEEVSNNARIKGDIASIDNNILKISFRTMVFQNKRRFLQKHVSKIIVDLKKCDVKIKWREESK